jgi:hypothetical protein
LRNIEREMARYNVTYYDIQGAMGCSEKTVRNKMQGVTDFTYSEVRNIRDRFFPGMSIEYLFDWHDDKTA